MICRRKLAFNTVEQAERSALIISRIKGTDHRPVRVYECDECGLLHWTSQETPRAGLQDSTVARVELPERIELPKPPPLPLKTKAPIPRLPPKPVKKTKPGVDAHIRDAERRALVARNDVAWMKDRVRNAVSFLIRGRTTEATALLDALVALPRQMHPSENLKAADAFVAKYAAEKMERLKPWRPEALFPRLSPAPRLESER